MFDFSIYIKFIVIINSLLTLVYVWCNFILQLSHLAPFSLNAWNEEYCLLSAILIAPVVNAITLLLYEKIINASKIIMSNIFLWGIVVNFYLLYGAVITYIWSWRNWKNSLVMLLISIPYILYFIYSNKKYFKRLCSSAIKIFLLYSIVFLLVSICFFGQITLFGNSPYFHWAPLAFSSSPD